MIDDALAHCPPNKKELSSAHRLWATVWADKNVIEKAKKNEDQLVCQTTKAREKTTTAIIMITA